MVDITVKRGLYVPIVGHPHGAPKKRAPPKKLSVDLRPLQGTAFRVLVREGESVSSLQPLVEVKDAPEIVIPSPVSGKVHAIARGQKRMLLEIVLERSEQQERRSNSSFSMGPDEIQNALYRSGLITRFFARPLHRPVVSTRFQKPRSCFVRAVTKKPFDVPYELQGSEAAFRIGIEAISTFLACPIHVVRDRPMTSDLPFQNVFFHTVSGPYPACSSSVHIQAIDPIRKVDESVWTIEGIDVARIGYFLQTQRLDMPMIIARAGEGFPDDERDFIETIEGASVEELIGPNENSIRLISGDPLTGYAIPPDGCMRRGATILSAIPEQDETKRTFLHFLRLGKTPFTATKTYLSGHMNPRRHSWHFTTSMHGEERTFIDGAIYEKVMPLPIFPMQLIKAIMAEEFDAAIEYGLLKVAPEDFAVCEFVCPSKTPMIQIVEEGIQRSIQEFL